MMKSLEQLLVPTEDSGIPFLNDLKNSAACTFEIIPVENQQDANANLYTLQVTTHSTLGTVAYYTGGLYEPVIDFSDQKHTSMSQTLTSFRDQRHPC